MCVNNERIEASPGERPAHLIAEQYRWARVTSERKARTGRGLLLGGGEGGTLLEVSATPKVTWETQPIH